MSSYYSQIAEQNEDLVSLVQEELDRQEIVIDSIEG